MVKLNLNELKDINGGVKEVYDYYREFNGYLIWGANYHIYISPEEYKDNLDDINTNRDQFIDNYILMHKDLERDEYENYGFFRLSYSERGTHRKKYTEIGYNN